MESTSAVVAIKKSISNGIITSKKTEQVFVIHALSKKANQRNAQKRDAKNIFQKKI
jgi:phage-related protein